MKHSLMRAPAFHHGSAASQQGRRDHHQNCQLQCPKIFRSIYQPALTLKLSPRSVGGVRRKGVTGAQTGGGVSISIYPDKPPDPGYMRRVRCICSQARKKGLAAMGPASLTNLASTAAHVSNSGQLGFLKLILALAKLYSVVWYTFCLPSVSIHMPLSHHISIFCPYKIIPNVTWRSVNNSPLRIFSRIARGYLIGSVVRQWIHCMQSLIQSFTSFLSAPGSHPWCI